MVSTLPMVHLLEWVTKTLLSSFPAPSPLSNFRIHCGPWVAVVLPPDPHWLVQLDPIKLLVQEWILLNEVNSELSRCRQTELLCGWIFQPQRSPRPGASSLSRPGTQASCRGRSAPNPTGHSCSFDFLLRTWHHTVTLAAVVVKEAQNQWFRGIVSKGCKVLIKANDCHYYKRTFWPLGPRANGTLRMD